MSDDSTTNGLTDLVVTQKALRINLDQLRFGSFAEIGAGQEVVRWFFRVGGAAGTVAKSISAYDMKFSDALYGSTHRYVSRQRLSSMLEHEYNILLERLADSRGDNTTFFTFADTVAASSYKFKREGSAWLGVRFQHQPRAQPSDIVIHARLLNRENLKQQQILGILGVNLIYGAFYMHEHPEQLIGSLLDELDSSLCEIDMIKFSGPAFATTDNRLMGLELVRQKLTNAIVMLPNGELIQSSELFYKKPVLIERGTFRPVTNVTVALLEAAVNQYTASHTIGHDDVMVLMELSTHSWEETKDDDWADYLSRVDMLQALGRPILISNYQRDYQLIDYLAQYTSLDIGIAMGIPHLRLLFHEENYVELEGGILESLGRLFQKRVRLYIYPFKDPATHQLITADNFQASTHLQHLYLYLLENKYVEKIQNYDEQLITIFPKDVIQKIRAKDHSWEKLVPGPVAEIIKKRGYFQQ